MISGLTYAKAGVSIEAGDDLVRRIGPIRRTRSSPASMLTPAFA